MEDESWVGRERIGLTLDEVEERLADLKLRMDAAIARNEADIKRLDLKIRVSSAFIASLEPLLLEGDDSCSHASYDSDSSSSFYDESSSSCSSSCSSSSSSEDEHDSSEDESDGESDGSSFSTTSSGSASSANDDSARSDHSSSASFLRTRESWDSHMTDSSSKVEAIRQLNHYQELKIRSMLQELRQKLVPARREDEETDSC